MKTLGSDLHRNDDQKISATFATSSIMRRPLSATKRGLIAGRGDPELEHPLVGLEGLGKPGDAGPVGGPEHHRVAVDVAHAFEAVAELGDAEAVAVDQVAEGIFRHLGGARKPHVQVVVGLGPDPGLDPGEQGQHPQGDDHRHDEREKEADPGHDPEGGGDPDRCRGGQAPDGKAFLEDHAGAQKTDAGHDALGHPRGVEPHRIGGQPDPIVFVNGDQHQQAGGRANQGMGPEARRPTVVRTLVPDHGPGHQRGQQPQDHLFVFYGEDHGLSLE